ncbi:DUF4167 domain-containing protein [Pelagibacteraceae bacterium]|nr:DUF4167 domain-containing protein [Pelagibacteraceae bacterium]
MTFKTNRRPNFKRNNNFSSKNRGKGNITQQYNKYLKLAKDTFSSGDRIQAEYYYQFTDHYYRLMVEFGIHPEEQDSSEDVKVINNENVNLNENKEVSNEENQKLDEEETKDDDIDQSIESVPFISEPVKKKRSRSSK